MSAAVTPMLSVRDARARTADFFEKHVREWAADAFMRGLGAFVASACSPACAPALAINLHPPTERQAFEAGRAARAWVDEWRSLPAARGCFVQWEQRQWSRVGPQSIPVRMRLEGADAIASFGRQAERWRVLCARMGQLAQSVRDSWGSSLARCNAEGLFAAVRRCAIGYESLSESDWLMVLRVLEWLSEHPGETCFVRQLPIRGIDTKWFERHRGSIEPLVQALTGAKPAFAKPPYQVRVRFLDSCLAPGALTDIKVLPSELADLPVVPRAAIICENLVNMLALPQMSGIVAVHGGGYAVSELAAVSWLERTRILYWGDLDSNGFAILNELRGVFSHAESVMMDAPTLYAYRDLCVSESKPNRGIFERLTSTEQAALALLLAEEPPLRLEQERIEWAYALSCLRKALDSPAAPADLPHGNG